MFCCWTFGLDHVLGVCTGGLQGHRQISDAFLRTAAARNGRKLAPFDTGVRRLLATDAERQRHVALLN